MNWWRTPPESPDANPIENLWHKLKADLVLGIQQFWATVDAQKCQKYIGHLRKVVPKIVELNGLATGY